jgi:hypothetical protein
VACATATSADLAVLPIELVARLADLKALFQLLLIANGKSSRLVTPQRLHECHRSLKKGWQSLPGGDLDPVGSP